MSTTLLRRISSLPGMIGWAGGIGVALLVCAAAYALTSLVPAAEEAERLGEELRQFERKAGKTDLAVQAARTPRQQLEEFRATLPKQDQINAQVALLHETAARNHLSLRNGEYRTSAAKGSDIGRLQITVRTDGSYSDVRRFLRELPAVLPALAVSRLSMMRQKPSDTALETNVEFALFFTRTDT